MYTFAFHIIHYIQPCYTYSLQDNTELSTLLKYTTNGVFNNNNNRLKVHFHWVLTQNLSFGEYSVLGKKTDEFLVHIKILIGSYKYFPYRRTYAQLMVNSGIFHSCLLTLFNDSKSIDDNKIYNNNCSYFVTKKKQDM